jgi:hypothetical protein
VAGKRSSSRDKNRPEVRKEMKDDPPLMRSKMKNKEEAEEEGGVEV